MSGLLVVSALGGCSWFAEEAEIGGESFDSADVRSFGSTPVGSLDSVGGFEPLVITDLPVEDDVVTRFDEFAIPIEQLPLPIDASLLSTVSLELAGGRQSPALLITEVEYLSMVSVDEVAEAFEVYEAGDHWRSSGESVAEGRTLLVSADDVRTTFGWSIGSVDGIPGSRIVLTSQASIEDSSSVGLPDGMSGLAAVPDEAVLTSVERRSQVRDGQFGQVVSVAFEMVDASAEEVASGIAERIGQAWAPPEDGYGLSVGFDLSPGPGYDQERLSVRSASNIVEIELVAIGGD